MESQHILMQDEYKPSTLDNILMIYNNTKKYYPCILLTILGVIQLAELTINNDINVILSLVSACLLFISAGMSILFEGFYKLGVGLTFIINICILTINIYLVIVSNDNISRVIAIIYLMTILVVMGILIGQLF